ncbi:MAG: alanine racemase [Shewanella sp.]|nr:alanine racemase [Shewanella sp.]MCF1429404.1 alanine racemase [Shewanella sp.]MCF1438775.1 alanine racemase [Shewanella sp.]MCF1456024.1 alanine racemase [Shewanella sp.]
MKPFPRAEIRLGALTHNLRQLKTLAPESRVLAIVKANAYGHGLLNVARHLDGEADGFGVARLEEALALRKGGVKGRVLLLGGFFIAEDLPTLVEHKIDTVVHHESQLEMLEQVQLDTPVNVWLKVDSGMHRLGFVAENFDAAYQRLLQCPNVASAVQLMTHFSRADEPEQKYTEYQLKVFDDLTATLPGDRSIANSAGTLFWPASRRDWIRPGIALYGISPMTGDVGSNHGLQPAMELKSRLIAVRDHKSGQPVGYGGYWHASRDTRVGVVAIGYGDGYPRNAPEGTPVWVNGRRVPVVGRVSMDMLTVDLGPDAADAVGDDVLLWGEALPLEEVAEHVGTIAYELMTTLMVRVAVCFE